MSGGAPRPGFRPGTKHLIAGGRLPQAQPLSHTEARREQGVNWSEADEQFFQDQAQDGGGFRSCIYFVFFLTALGLFLLKFQRDTLVPDAEVEPKPAGAAEGSDLESYEAKAEEFYRNLPPEPVKVKEDDEEVGESEVEEGESSEGRKEKAKPDDYSREELEKRYHEELRTLSKCEGMDKSECNDKSKALTTSWNQVASHLDHNLFDTLKLDAKHANPVSIRKAYEEASQNPDMSSKQLMQLKEARDILLNPGTRTYYVLYGKRPPEQMKHISSTDGGWGLRVALGTYKFTFFDAWLEHFGHDPIAQLCVILVFLVPIFLSVYPRFYELLKLAERLEKQWRDEEPEDEGDDSHGGRRRGGAQHRRGAGPRRF
eukprot:NODE_1657_length_1340_cov_23.687839_g1373_i0.p1 GENE.NODE_1657_length_1340_cov_23.687839_g1373_i0~~NODE_1657_length_1340_cov_23.687839_g1373_i0.p1  ORF type:complete len:372 (-),score=66.74 NODE_1657_length_1340_cov_23.687839_g1373_i0:116-1231(-)